MDHLHTFEKCRGAVSAFKKKMLSGNVDASEGDGETKQRGHDFEIAATVRSGHKRRGEREARGVACAAHNIGP